MSNPVTEAGPVGHDAEISASGDPAGELGIRTTESASGSAVPDALTVAGIRAAIAPILRRLADTAHERETRRDYAFDDVRALADAGIVLTGIPVREGGAGGSVRDVFDLIIEVARADSSVAQALRSSFLLADQVVSRPDLPNRAASLQRIRDRALFAGTANERNGGPSGEVTATARRDGEDWIVDGDKYYSTGGLYASWFSTQARTEDGEVIRFTVPTDREGVERLDDFDAVGQRLTASGTTRLRGVRVAADEVNVIGEAELDNPFTGAVAQLYLAAVQAGLAARALDDAVWFVREKARPIKHSTADKSVDDPYVRETVGRIAAKAQAARSVVLLAAEAIEGVRGRTGDDARQAGAAASVQVAQAGVIAIESALEATELLFDVGGGSITDRTLGFDRHWRNSRTAANHNPRQWKQAVAGAYHLTGEEPPTTGLF
ncbi:acyl-CoA dehydrogenase family protein [Nocardia higoensis]|uniref:acyl-CoA dehydrogenase family protein n=1 Tax=Nocardia higoensis TaxID=228599 RepID=UPI000302784C|nr:acyl-CoA dehydrogenase family protein [Nocardia higoensis]